MKFRTLVLTAVAAISLAATSEARVLKFQYQGTVTSFPGFRSIDTLGLFGAPGADLTGAKFLYIQSIDLSANQIVSVSQPPDSSGNVFSGQYNQQLSHGSVTSALTIKGHTDVVDDYVAGIVDVDQRVGPTYFHSEAISENVGHDASGSLTDIILIAASDSSIVQAGGLTQPYRWHAGDPGGITTAGEIDHLDSSGNYVGAYLYFDINSIYLAAPEPSAWTGMLLGFGALGMVLRRRRAVPVA